ncbi:MAG TPA: hypothetical protein VG448_03770 [Solirubrobacterales bacterium]|nr:hypothetical protein [Solirubrobacterales bacterium]
MSREPAEQGGEVRLAPESIEAIARRLAELVGGAAAQRPRPELISAEDVSRWWGVSRRWVYANAKRLGAKPIGTGSRPRIRFDPDEVAEQLGEPPGRPDVQGSPAIGSDCRTDSLSSRTRASVGARDKRRRRGCIRLPPIPGEG